MNKSVTKVVRVGCLNVRGVNEEGKREEIGVLFEERGLDILALSETKLYCLVNLKV